MFKRQRILIVHDNRHRVFELKMQLRAEGYQTTVAPHTGAVVRAAILGQPDLVLLDLGLEERGGLAVLKRLQGIVSTAQIPVITTGDVSLKEQALENGAAAFYPTPFDDAELLVGIAMSLDAEKERESARMIAPSMAALVAGSRHQSARPGQRPTKEDDSHV